MALSAVVTIPASTVQVAQVFRALLTISSSNATETIITQVVPFCTSADTVSPVSAQLGLVSVPANSPVQPSGTLPLTFSVVFQAGSGNGTISIGALVYGADGELISATPATITVVGNNQNA